MQAAVGYIATPTGLVLHANGDDAVLVRWDRQSPLQGFSGYGRIHLEGRCLTGRGEGASLRWEGCRLGDKAQVWKLVGERLSNELEHCAEVDGAAPGRVLAHACTGEPRQRWRALRAETVQDVAARISRSDVRNTFLRSIAAGPAGSLVSLDSGRILKASGSSAGGMAVNLGGGSVVLLPGPD